MKRLWPALGFTALLLTAGYAADWNFKDSVGVGFNSAIKMPIEFDYSGGFKPRGSFHCDGPKGEEPCQQLTSGKFQLSLRHPKSILNKTYISDNIKYSPNYCTPGRLDIDTPTIDYPDFVVDDVYQFHNTTNSTPSIPVDTDLYVKTLDTMCSDHGVIMAATAGGTAISITENASWILTLQGLKYESGCTCWRVPSGHEFLDGDPIKFKTTGSLPVTTPTQIDTSTTYFAKYIDSQHIKIYTTVALSTPITSTSDGTGVHSIWSDYDYSVNSGAATALPTNPVVVTKVGNDYEITNGLGGVSFPSCSSNSENKAPIQGIQGITGTWTGRGYSGAPNYLYREPVASTGDGTQPALEAAWGGTACSFVFLEQGPMLVKVRIHYDYTLTNYTIGATPVPNDGFTSYTATVAVSADVPGFTIWDDVHNLAAGYRVNIASTAIDTIRYSQASTTRNNGPDITHTLTADTQAYRLCFACVYDGDNDNNGTYTRYTGVYLVGYQAAGASNTPAIGVHTGWFDIGAVNSNRVEKHIWAVSASPDFGGGAATFLGLFWNMNQGSSVIGSLSRQIGVWYGERSQVSASDLTVNPEIAKYTYSMGELGPNRLQDSSIYNFNFSAPGAGNYLYQSAADGAALVSKVRTNSGYFNGSSGTLDADLSTDPDGHAIAMAWFTNTTDAYAMLVRSLDRSTYRFMHSMELRGVHANNINYYEGVTPFVRALAISGGGFPDSNLVTPYLERLKLHNGLANGILFDERYFPLSGATAFEGYGLPNQWAEYKAFRSLYNYYSNTNPINRNFRASIDNLHGGDLAYSIQPDGSCPNSYHYCGSNVDPLVEATSARHFSGVLSLTSDESALFVKYMEWEMDLSAPPDARANHFRTKAVGSDGTVELIDGTAPISALTGDGRGWAFWNANGRFRGAYFASSVLAIKDTFTTSVAPLASRNYPYYGPVLRYGYGTTYETWLTMITRTAIDHIHGAEGASNTISFHVLDAPVTTVFDGNAPSGGLERGHAASNIIKNRPTNESEFTTHGIAWDDDAQPLASGSAFSTSYGVSSYTSEFEAFRFGGYTTGKSTAANGSVFYRSASVLADDPAATIIVIDDQWTGTDATASKILPLNMYSEGAVSGYGTPVTRNYLTQEPSNGDTAPTPHNITFTNTALVTLGFTGETTLVNKVDWKLYMIPSASGSYYVGDYSYPFVDSTVSALAGGNLNHMQLLRVKTSGDMRTLYLVYPKGSAPASLSVTRSGTDYLITYTGVSRTIGLHYDTYASGSVATIRAKDSGSYTALSMTVSGGAQEVYKNGSTIEWRPTGLVAGVRTVDLSAVCGTGCTADKPVGTTGSGVFTRYHDGSSTASVVTFTINSATAIRTVHSSPRRASGSMRVMINGEWVGLYACSTTCPEVFLAPVGDYLEQHQAEDSSHVATEALTGSKAFGVQ